MQARGDKSEQSARTDQRAPTAYWFAGYRLLANYQRLESDGDPVVLTTKLYHLLLTFLTHPGQVVSKKFIVDAVWPGQVVTDAALAKQIQRLRMTLNDGERDPPLIETHRGRGYRMTCPVTVESEEISASERQLSGAAEEAAGFSAWRHKSLLFALSATVVLGLGLYFFANPQGEGPAKTRSIAVIPVAHQTSALSEGAAEYLATRLGAPVNLAPLLKTDKSAEQAIKLGSLELFRLRKTPVIALRLERQSESFSLWIDVRNETGSSHIQLKDASIARLLAQGENWTREQIGLEGPTWPTDNRYALTSHFEGLASGDCDYSVQYFKAAVASDPSFMNAQLQLARCEQASGNNHDAAATAIAVINALTASTPSSVELNAHTIAARAFLELGDAEAARSHLEAASRLSSSALSPLQEMSSIAVLSLLASMDKAPAKALELQKRRLELARQEYPLPAYLAGIHLDIAELALTTGDYTTMRSQADKARVLAEEHGEPETLMRSYRFLITTYFRVDDMEAAVQLALAARPILKRTPDVADKAFFMQFAATALTAGGLIDESREYTDQLRRLAVSTANLTYGAMADFTVLHRRYAQDDFARAYTLAASARARLESETGSHSSLPEFVAFEAIAASRGASIDVAQKLVDELESRYPDMKALKGPALRAKGHILVRSGSIREGLRVLRQAEEAMRQIGMKAIADYIGYEISELRLKTEDQAPWDDINRLTVEGQRNYYISRLTAKAHALDGNFLSATTALEEARLRGKQLWSPSDQLLLEMYQSKLATAQVE